MHPSASPIFPAPSLVSGRAGRNHRIGRPTGKTKGGQASWLKRLLSSGRIREAYAYAQAHSLLPLMAGVPLPAAQPDGGEGGQPASQDNYN